MGPHFSFQTEIEEQYANLSFFLLYAILHLNFALTVDAVPVSMYFKIISPWDL